MSAAPKDTVAADTTARSGTRRFVFPDGTSADLGEAEYAKAQKWLAMERDADDSEDDELSLGQNVVKFGADMAPPVLGALGTALGFTGGAGLTIPAGGVGSVPLGIGGGVIGTTGGTAIRDIAYDLAGIPMDRSLGARAGRLGMGAIEGAIGGGAQSLASKAAMQLPKLAEPTMKAAIGNAAPGVQKLFLKYGVKPTVEGAAHAQTLMNAQMGVRQAAIDAAEASGLKFSWRGLRGALGTRLRAQQRADLLSTDGEAALQRAAKVLEEKLSRGEQVATRIGTKSTTSGPSTIYTNSGGRPINPKPIYGPPQPITPKRMEEIKELAAEEAKKLYDARVEMKNSTPSVMEKAYEEIAKQARRELNRIPKVREVNRTYKELREVLKAARNAAKRSSGTSTVASVLTGVGSGASTGAAAAMAGHNPALALWGIPVGAAVGGATKIGTDPSGLASIAQLLDNPKLMAKVATALGYGTRIPEAAVSGMGGFSPYDPSLPVPQRKH